ncbi:DUF4375 domain-containing protein [Sinorhizobium sp. RAC02]|uniref:DMP19 family protein n=1 Tax=Sinorhizobium sp. RAC02 TaxID=1842534 RepID=UPI00085886E7|nr:DUF4375 domain-containing protein [Sinorhizobium sp. RAC02]AOF88749.1 hypothetical protein BSY16_1527 [Sinorhizobium sp. RAC02]
MFGKVFGRRATAPPPSRIIPVSSERAADAGELVAAVVDFVNHLFTQGFYRPEELPPHLVHLYHADFYIAQVCNGGHSQFVHNCGARVQAISANAEAGLMAMGARSQAALVHELALWVAANPESASAQTGFTGGRDPALDRLDARFRTADVDDPATDLAAAWVRTWPDIRILEHADFNAAWDQSALSNPKRSSRLSKARVETFRQSLSDRPHLALGLAADDADETLLDDGNVQMIALDGRYQDARVIQTSFGLRGAVYNGGDVRLYALRFEGGDVNVTATALIGSARKVDIDRFVAFIAEEPVAAAADLLLSRARPLAIHCTIQPCGGYDGIPHPAFRVTAGDEILILAKAKTGYILAGQKPGEIYGPVPYAQIAAHEQELRDT